MSSESKINSAANAIGGSQKIHHAKLSDIEQFTPEKLGHLKRGGIRSGPSRSETQAQQMLDKIPPSQRAGADGQSAAAKVKEYLVKKDASHIKPHAQGGSSDPSNIKWEDQNINRRRGNQYMTRQEQMQLDAKARTENWTGAWKSGLEAAPKGAMIGIATTIPFSLLRNALRVVRGEISAQDAAIETVKETAVGGGVGAVSAVTVTTIATACPPVAAALAVCSPALLVLGGAGMVWQFFKTLEGHKSQTQKYYESLTQGELDHLKKLEEELLYEHTKNMKFLDEAQRSNAEISKRPMEAGVEGALKRYLESAAIAQSLGANPVGSKMLLSSQKFLSTND